jgi:hypothetical protein
MSMHPVRTPAPARPGRFPLIAALGWLALWSSTAAAQSAGSTDGSQREPRADQPVELGTVAWGEDFEQGLREVRRDGRPMFLLFQEIPGCATCVGFGRSVLSRPLLAEAIETEFVAVAVHNNRGGEDRRVLERFGEPAWNNPVVRFVDGEGRDLLARKDGVYSAGEIAARMIAALEAAGRPVPEYLRLEAAETAAGDGRSMLFTMGCFWAGEACLGGIDGVVSSRVGFLDGREAVELHYDPRRTDLRSLLRRARESNCADAVVARDEAEAAVAREVYDEAWYRSDTPLRLAGAADQKRQLTGVWRSLAMSEMQRVRVNHERGRGGDGRCWLSPRQLRLVDDPGGSR